MFNSAPKYLNIKEISNWYKQFINKLIIRQIDILFLQLMPINRLLELIDKLL